MHRLEAEDRNAIKKVLDIKHYDPDTFNPEVLDELEANEEYKSIIRKHGQDILKSEEYIENIFGSPSMYVCSSTVNCYSPSVNGDSSAMNRVCGQLRRCFHPALRRFAAIP